MNNNQPFPGERLLHRLLDKTYFAHVLPPMRETEKSRLEQLEDELPSLFGKGSQAVRQVWEWLEDFRGGLRGRK